MDNCKILIVDDLKTIRKIMKRVLLKLAYSDVEEAENGLGAFELLTQNKYDIILSDCYMPHMDGVELVRKVRLESNKNKNTPFILITSENKDIVLEEAFHAGISDYLIKPFENNSLAHKINFLLKNGHKNLSLKST